MSNGREIPLQMWCQCLLMTIFRNIQKYWHDRCDVSICWCNIQGKDNVLPVFGVLLNARQKYWNHLYCQTSSKAILVQKPESSAALVEDVAEAIASYQNHRYYIASNIGLFLLYTSGTPTPPHLGPGQILLRILLQYFWSLAISLLSYYYCVFWQMQLLRFSYFSKFQYYIDVLNIQKKSDFFAESQRGWLQCGIVW